MNKLSFRARALDASKPMPIYMSEELPDLPEYSAINRAVPQMPSGMEKEEECEHHLQRAIVTGLIIPTPEVIHMGDTSMYDRLYPPSYKVPRQLIHMQPFTMEHDIPDYDMDSEDELWVNVQMKVMDITPLKFEEMMDRLEKNSGHSVVTQCEAKVLLKEDDDLIIAVYDYWLNKRLKTQTPLIPCVKTEAHRGGNNNNNPYLAFRRRTEKMQTRKNRKNDETSYEKMVKLRRDLSRALTLLELVKRRENTKRELFHLTIEVYEKRYQANDFSGQLLAEVSAMKYSRPAFAPLFTNQYGVHNHSANNNWAKPPKEDVAPRKRQYKKRKHKSTSILSSSVLMPGDLPGLISSGDDEVLLSPQSPHSEEVPFVFHRNKLCKYQAPVGNVGLGNWPWCSREEGGMADRKFRYSLTSVAIPKTRCIGYARRRLGRGGRIILDRAGPSMDEYWEDMDFTIHDSTKEKERLNLELSKDRLHYCPAEESPDVLNSNSLTLQVEDLVDDHVTNVQLNLSELFPSLADIFSLDTNPPGFPMDMDLKTSLVKMDDKKESRPSAESKITISEQKNVSDSFVSGNSSFLKESPLTGSLVERLSSGPSLSNSNSLLKRNRSAAVNLNCVTSRKNVCRVFNNEIRENSSGSLLDRWARFEGNPDPGGMGTRIKRSKLSVSQFTSDEQMGCSMFKTTSNDLKTISKHSLPNNVKKSANLELTHLNYNGYISSDILVTNEMAGVNSVNERVAMPVSLVKESSVQSHRQSSSPVHHHQSLLRHPPSSDIRPQGFCNGLVNPPDLPPGRVVHLSNSLVTYHKNRGNLNVNNKIISLVPTETIDLSDEFMTGAPVKTDKTKIQHVTKNGILPMEVT